MSTANVQNTEAGRTHQSREYHPLAQQQYNQVVRRPWNIRQKLAGVWGVTWSLQGRTWAKLGTASMMVISYHPSGNNERDAIELRCISAYYDAESNTIVYGKVRMSHDFGRVVYPGARERTLDPRDPADNQYNAGNASWVRLALALDLEASKAASHDSHLPVIPKLPEFYAAFSSMDAIDMDITPDILRLVAEKRGISVEAASQLDMSEQMQEAAVFWPDLWLEPNGEGNATNKWLINTRYTRQLAKAEQLYEDFSDLVGCQVWNPIKEVREYVLPNPAEALAKANDVDLAALFRTLDTGHAADDVVHAAGEAIDRHNATPGDDSVSMTPTEFANNADYAGQMLTALIQAMRDSIPPVYSKQLSDDHIVQLLRNPKAKATLPISDPATQMLPEDALQAARAVLQRDRPAVSECTTDADILDVYMLPKQPLTASRMPQLQILSRDPRVPVEESFAFGVGMCAPNVAANLWAGPNWIPESPKGIRNDRQTRAPAAVRSVVISAD